MLLTSDATLITFITSICIRLQTYWMPFVTCKANFWLEDQDRQFFYYGIQASEKCWTKCISAVGDCVKKLRTHCSVKHDGLQTFSVFRIYAVLLTFFVTLALRKVHTNLGYLTPFLFWVRNLYRTDRQTYETELYCSLSGQWHNNDNNKKTFITSISIRLLQRLSVAVQRGNAVSFHSTFSTDQTLLWSTC